jgi:hypothetical protein
MENFAKDLTLWVEPTNGVDTKIYIIGRALPSGWFVESGSSVLSEDNLIVAASGCFTFMAKSNPEGQ